jgi:hypothetical protein
MVVSVDGRKAGTLDPVRRNDQLGFGTPFGQT